MSEQRERWTSRPAFIMAVIGSAVGLGNVWRFPYVCAKSGGGAFLIPYFVALLTAGIPLMILEYGLGQYLQGSAPKALRQIKKPFEWVGWWALMIGLVVSFYYVVIMAWAWDYLYYSVKALFDPSILEMWKKDAGAFFTKEVIQSTDSVYDIGSLSIPVVIGLALTWLCIYFIIKKGVRRVGKIVMITVPLPVILLGVMVVYGLFQPGAIDGINYYLTPDFSKLADAEVWIMAYGQIFFSLSIGWGILIAYASYMPKKSDITNNAFIVSLADCGTSFFAGFAVFSVFGYMAQVNNVAVEGVCSKGIGMAFFTYPTALGIMGGVSGAVIAALFFITLLSLGIDSAFSIVEAVLAGMEDKFRFNKEKITAVICIIGFLIGLFFCTGAGIYWLDIVDNWMNNFGLVVIGLLECILIGWFWKTKPFKEYINSVSEIKIGLWWDICIKVITPVILIISLGVTFYNTLTKEPYGQNEIFCDKSDIQAMADKLFTASDSGEHGRYVSELDIDKLAEKIEKDEIPPGQIDRVLANRGMKQAEGADNKAIYLRMAQDDIIQMRACFVDKGCSGIIKDKALWAPKTMSEFLKTKLEKKIGKDGVSEVLAKNDYPSSSLILGGWSIAILVCVLGLVFMLFKWKGGEA